MRFLLRPGTWCTPTTAPHELSGRAVSGPTRPARRAGLLPISGLLVAALLSGCSSGPSVRSPGDLTNPALSPRFSQWLVGPIARMASEEELRSYLALSDDEAARSFIEDFWARRDPDPDRPGNRIRELFQRRAETADRRFSEAGYLGRRTDRGTIFVLFGEPEETTFETSPRRGGDPIIVWVYGREPERGLHGEKPQRWYRFVKRGDLTVFYDARRSRRPLSDEPF